MWRATMFWCAVTAGAAALAAGTTLGAMQAGDRVAAFAASAVALLAMALLPPMFARRSGARATIFTATALVLTMAAMSFAANQARAGATHIALPLVLAGIALLMSARRIAPEARQFVSIARRAGTPNLNGAMIGAAWLAGMSSGLLARFQLFALCGAGPLSLAHLLVPLGAAIGAGAYLQRIERHHALLWLFMLRGVLLASLTLDVFAPWAPYAAPVFTVLDALTLPTLLRNDHAHHGGQGRCPGIAHHIGMVAGATFATTTWGFGQGYYVLFLGAAVLNLVCASAQATPRKRRVAHYGTRAISADFR